MNTEDFDFYLPERLVAQSPSEKRGEDRLLVLDSKTGEYKDYEFTDLPNLISPSTLVVFNNSRVRKARVFGSNKETGGQVEFLFLEPYEEGRVWRVMAKRNKRQREGNVYSFNDTAEAELVSFDSIITTDEQRKDSLKEEFADSKFLRFNSIVTDTWFEKNGHVPLPPYIKREDCLEDEERYQTVYADEVGSVAAPTAGLHFTDKLLQELKAKNIMTTTVTLHVGLGTFLPVRTSKIEEHKMHSENFFISEETANLIERQKQSGNPILAVGTTSVRSLETAWNIESNKLERGWQSSSIFIYPGYEFKVVDKLLTNFHTPKSTLMMLVSALAGRDNIMNAYKHAVEKEYRFFSYGDAMLIK